MDDQMLHHFMQDLIAIVVFPSLIFAFTWIIGMIIHAFRHRATLRAQAEFHNRILEKFSSAAEFTDYLKSEAGRDFFESLGSEPATPMTRILSSIQRGIILTLLGAAFFLTRFVIGTADSYSIMIIIATVLVMLGIGFLISSVVSHRLAKSWGLIQNDKGKISVPSTATSI